MSADRNTCIELEKGAGEVIRIGLTEYRGRKYLDARVYFETDEGQWKPTKKGLCLSPDLAQQVAEAMLTEVGKS